MEHMHIPHAHELLYSTDRAVEEKQTRACIRWYLPTKLHGIASHMAVIFKTISRFCSANHLIR
jgi:hypothetical protein